MNNMDYAFQELERVHQEKQLHKKILKNREYTDCKTKYSSFGFEDSFNKSRKTLLLTEEQITSLEPYEIFKLRQEALKNKALFCAEKNPTELDYKLLDLIFRDKVIPMFFRNKLSSSISNKSAKDFYAEKQYANNYFMPITVKSFKKRRITGRTSEDVDMSTGEVKKFGKAVSYVQTSKNNINGVLDVVIDIDFHNESKTYDELVDLSSSVDFFANEAGVQATAIVVTGQGIQLHYVLEQPVYRNSKNIDKLLETFNKKLKDVINTEVLPNIAGCEYVKCDEALNPVSQKVRLPGTLNFVSFTYSHVVILNEDRLYHIGNFLNKFLGDYEDYRESIRLKIKENEEKKSKRKGGNHGNGRHNLSNALEKRINDISDAIVFQSEFQSTGFRNNGYLTLVWQMLNLKTLNKKMVTEYISNIDAKLSVPYFKNMSAIERFVDSAERTMHSSKNKALTNKKIESYCTSLQFAKDNGMEFEIFFKETVEEQRKKKRLAKQEERGMLIKKLKTNVLNGVDITNIARKLNVARNTVYAMIKECLSEFQIVVDKVSGSLELLRLKLIEKIIEGRKSKGGEPAFVEEEHRADELKNNSAQYILFNTEKLNTEKNKHKIRSFLDEIFNKLNPVCNAI